jgi:HlyD family secretion protein
MTLQTKTQVPRPPMISEPLATDHRLPPARRRRGAVLALLALTLAGSAAAWWAWAAAEPGVALAQLRVAEVARGTLVRDAQVTGRTVAATSPTLYAPAAGSVALAVRAGDTVARGQLLATLSSPELAAEQAREQATLRGLEADLGRQRILTQQQAAAAEREAAEAQLAAQAAARDDERLRAACQQGVVPLVDCLRVQDAVRAAQVRSRHSERSATLAQQNAAFELQSLAQRVARQQAVVAELGRRLASLQVLAPVAGLAGSVAVSEGAAVALNTPLMTVVDLSQLEVELQLPEAVAEELSPGLAVELRIGAVQALGTLLSIAPEVQRGQVLARVRFQGAQPEGLRQNQRLSARVLIDERPNVLLLPRGPFVEAQGGHHAWVLEGPDGQHAVRRSITLGALGVAAVEISAGLQAGERVVIAGTEHLGDATRVRLQD